MRYRIPLPQHHLILDAFVAAVLLTILRLASSLLIQALLDSVFILGRKPTPRSHQLAHLSRRTTAETIGEGDRRPRGLLRVFRLTKPLALTFMALAAAAGHFTLMMTNIDPQPPILVSENAIAPIVVQVGGRVEKVHVKEGSVVLVGDPVVELDTHDLLIEKRILESRIHLAERHSPEYRLPLSDVYRQIKELQVEIGQKSITSPVDGVMIFVETLPRGETLARGIAIAAVACGKTQKAPEGDPSSAFVAKLKPRQERWPRR
jgi:hypothetical protein